MYSDKQLRFIGHRYYSDDQIENAMWLTSIESYYDILNSVHIPSYEDEEFDAEYESNPVVSDHNTKILILNDFVFSKDTKKKKLIDLSLFHIYPNIIEVFIEYFEVDVGNELIFNFDSLSKLKKIEKLTINGAYIKDLDFLSKLKNLKHLIIDNEIVPIK